MELDISDIDPDRSILLQLIGRRPENIFWEHGFDIENREKYIIFSYQIMLLQLKLKHGIFYDLSDESGILKSYKRRTDPELLQFMDDIAGYLVDLQRSHDMDGDTRSELNGYIMASAVIQCRIKDGSFYELASEQGYVKK